MTARRAMILLLSPCGAALWQALTLRAASPPLSRPSARRLTAPSTRPAVSPDQFLAVAQDVEPVAEALCRAETPDQNCDFAILIDRDPRVGANAFQTTDRSGRPIIILSLGLVATLQSTDELAFVLGHEIRASHRAAHSRSSAHLRRKGPVSSARSPSPAAAMPATCAVRRNWARRWVRAPIRATPNSRPTPSARPSPTARGTIRSQGRSFSCAFPIPGMRSCRPIRPTSSASAPSRRAVAALRASGVP
jgi:hypothetical protein